jgi:hypothetical protein
MATKTNQERGATTPVQAESARRIAALFTGERSRTDDGDTRRSVGRVDRAALTEVQAARSVRGETCSLRLGICRQINATRTKPRPTRRLVLPSEATHQLTGFGLRDRNDVRYGAVLLREVTLGNHQPTLYGCIGISVELNHSIQPFRRSPGGCGRAHGDKLLADSSERRHCDERLLDSLFGSFARWFHFCKVSESGVAAHRAIPD